MTRKKTTLIIINWWGKGERKMFKMKLAHTFLGCVKFAINANKSLGKGYKIVVQNTRKTIKIIIFENIAYFF